MVIDTSISDAEVDRLFRALADATRRDILTRVLVGPQSVSALATQYSMSFAAVHKHVGVLEGAGLVTKHAQGRERMVHGDVAAISTAQTLLQRYERLWRSRIQQLDDVLAEGLH
jgi:DNA-binding transcriptional ArsR family regulator